MSYTAKSKTLQKLIDNIGKKPDQIKSEAVQTIQENKYRSAKGRKEKPLTSRQKALKKRNEKMKQVGLEPLPGKWRYLA